MAEAPTPAVFSIPTHRVFADALVDGLIEQFAGKAAGLGGGIVLVPNNRAATAIQNAFVRRAEKGLLLPRLVPIGDPDLGEKVGSALDPADAEPIPPAVDPMRRQMILARMLQQTLPVERMGVLDGAQAMRLARELGQVLDQLTVERVSPRQLQSMEEEGLSQYWQESLKLLGLIADDWPKILRQLGEIDLTDRRNRQLDALAERWRVSPPQGFVVAAGISTAAPAVAGVVRAVSRLDRGQVVFAGLDLDMPEHVWDTLAGKPDEIDAPAQEAHPQYHLRLLLDRIGVPRALVREWDWGKQDRELASRCRVLNLAMAPPVFTKEWANTSDANRRLTNLHALELASSADEAITIALALRHALERAGETAALVTPDRTLAARVSAHLKRWGIQADDSAGVALTATPPGTLLLSIAHAIVSRFAPTDVLMLLKHPLVHGGMDRLEWLDGVRTLDLALRGPRPAPGLAGIDLLLAQQDRYNAKVRQAAAAWWSQVRAALTPLERECGGFSDQLKLLREAAEQLAGEAVWAGEAGRMLADLMTDLEALAPEGPADVAIETLPMLLRDAMDAVAVRPARGGHPRIFIWGLLEAKLQSADLMILAGLNETVWPQLPSPDPWLAPVIRRKLGLPGLDRRIGLSAHDLVSAANAKRVLLTRSKRDGRAPSIASRFWLRLETLVNGIEAPDVRYDLIARALDFDKGQRATRPAPNPPVEARPKIVSVTDVDALKSDPYTFYARHILKLSALGAPGEEPDMRWRGTFLHEILADWGRKDGFAKGGLLPRLELAFDQSGLHNVVKLFWQPRFAEAADFFEEQVALGRTKGREPRFAEIAGAIKSGELTLKGRADRIDTLPDGGLAIVDYKTGRPPSTKQAMEGFSTQLGLLGHMADLGGFEGVTGVSQKFEYWSQARGKDQRYGLISSPAGEGKKNKADPASFAAETFAQFTDAASFWLVNQNPLTAKLRPEFAYSEFDQLMRYEEWQGRDG